MGSIKPVEFSERKLGAWDLTAIWFGAGISIAEFWAGALLTPGTTLFKGFLANVIGHVIGNTLLGLVAIIGFTVGLPTMVLFRKSLGLRGSFIASALNYIQLIGWTAVMNIVAARALQEVFSTFDVNLDYTLAVVLMGLLNTLWAIAGPEKWRYIGKISASLLLVLISWLTVVTIKSVGSFDWNIGEGTMPFTTALDLVVAMPVSWIPLVADYSRFVKSNKKGVFFATALGYFASSGLFYFIGSTTNAFLGAPDPIKIIAFYGLGIPAMIIIILSTTTTTFMDIYSAAVSIINIDPRRNITKQTLLAGLLGTIIAVVFPIDKYEHFLLFIGAAFIPLTSIIIADCYIIEKGSYEPNKILNSPEYNIAGIASWAIGFAIYIAITYTVPWIGGTLPTILSTMIIYIILHRITLSQ